MIAALPMYLFPETRDAHELFWAHVRDRLRAAGLDAPETLSHSIAPKTVWADPNLVLSHICNLPYRRYFRGSVTRIAGSDYGLADCAPGTYRALFVARKDHPAASPNELDGATMAINEADSHSGWGAAALWAQARGLRFRPVISTGSHRASIAAVASGTADFATIDAQSFRILRRQEGATDTLKVLGSTDQSPGMTFITRKGENPAPYREALSGGLAALGDRDRAILGLRGFPVLPDAAFDIPLPSAPPLPDG
ncbi:MAG: PhnD/SsuA/transferrin family substrate-binding protein [Pseudomonadota bacterium]